MIPILRKAIESFNILRARFSQLVQFFHSIVSLVKNVFGNHTARLTDALGNGKNLVLGGVSLSGSPVKNLSFGSRSADRPHYRLYQRFNMSRMHGFFEVSKRRCGRFEAESRYLVNPELPYSPRK